MNTLMIALAALSALAFVLAASGAQALRRRPAPAPFTNDFHLDLDEPPAELARRHTPRELRAMGFVGPATWACGEDCGRPGCCA